MKLLTAPTILSIAVIATLLLPAGAIVGSMGSPTDDLFEGEPSVEMAAHDGPNGEYVEAAEDGQLEIDFSDPGVNAEAFTGAERVFDLVNTDTANVTVWVTHDGDDAVTLYDDATDAPIESENSAIELAPGEVVTVSIDIDTTGAVAGDRLLSTVTLHAKYDADLPEFGVAIDGITEEVTEGEPVTVDATVTNDGDAAGNQTVELVVDGEVVDQRDVSLGPGESTTVEFSFDAGSDDVDVTVRTGDRSAQRTVTVTAATADDGGGEPGNAGTGIGGETTNGTDDVSVPGEEELGGEEADADVDAEVAFDDGSDTSEVSIRTVDVSELDTDPMEDPDRPPLAVINSEDAETRADDPNGGVADAPDAEAFDVRTLVGESVELTGERSKIGAAEAVSNRERITQLVNIEVPPERESQPATVRLRVDRDRLDDIQAEETMVGHRTDEGWELLETRVVDRTEDSVIVEARTPGFSPFAVFSPPSVTYEWELPDGTVLEGQQIDPTFEDPGFYDIELTVTDRFDRQSTTTHRVLANDVPEATVEVVDRDGDQVTLAANVTDEVGETEVTWTFPDGTERTGEAVTHTLEPGEHAIELRVVDEYGAEAESEHTVAVGPPGSPAAVADAFGMDLEILVQLGLLSGIGLALAVGYRQFPWGIFAWRPRRGPKITVFSAPTIETSARRFLIEELEVEDPGCELDTITIEILGADGSGVIEKRLDISGMTTYTASPETLAVPPGVDVDPEGSYTVRIKATDTDGRSTERDLSAVHASANRSGRESAAR